MTKKRNQPIGLAIIYLFTLILNATVFIYFNNDALLVSIAKYFGLTFGGYLFTGFGASIFKIYGLMIPFIIPNLYLFYKFNIRRRIT